MRLLYIVLLLSVVSLFILHADETVLFDFENTDELSWWKPGAATAELSTEHATRGAHSIKVVFSEGDGLKMFMYDHNKPKLDLSGSTHIAVDLFAPAPIGITFKLKSDNHKLKWDRAYKLEQGPQTIQVAFETCGINPAGLDYINFFTTAAGMVYIDNIRGIKMQTAPVIKPEEMKLFSFEEAESLAAWDWGGTKAEFTDEHVTDGKQAVQITFYKGQGLKTFIFSGREIPLKNATHLLIDYFAPVNMEITVKLKSDGQSIKWDREYSLEPEAATLSIPFEGTGINPESLCYINIWVNSPRSDTILFIDNIRGDIVVAGSAPKGPKKPEKMDEELF